MIAKTKNTPGSNLKAPARTKPSADNTNEMIAAATSKATMRCKRCTVLPHPGFPDPYLTI